MTRLTILSLTLALAIIEPRATSQTSTDMNEAAHVEVHGRRRRAQLRLPADPSRRISPISSSYRASRPRNAPGGFRDAHVQAIYPAADKRRAYGSIYPLCRWQVLTELTRARTTQLEAWTKPSARATPAPAAEARSRI